MSFDQVSDGDVIYSQFDGNDGGPNLYGFVHPTAHYENRGVGSQSRKTSDMSMSSGKYYYEITISNGSHGGNIGYTGSAGISSAGGSGTEFLGDNVGDYGWRYDGMLVHNGTTTAFGSGVSANNDVVMVAVDADNGFVYFGKNGTWFNGGDPTSGATGTGAAFSGITGSYDFAVGSEHGGGGVLVHSPVNFGQTDYTYTPPAGFDGLSDIIDLPEGVEAAVATPTGGHDYYEGDDTSETIDGLAGNDKLMGNGGDDTLTGGEGNDHLIGGAGDDVYGFARGDGVDTIDNAGEATSHDKVSFGAGISADQLWFRQDGDDLEVSIIGTDDTVVIDDWYVGSDNTVSSIETNSGDTLAAANVANLVSAMSSFAPPTIGQTTLSSAGLDDDLNAVIAANWQTGS